MSWGSHLMYISQAELQDFVSQDAADISEPKQGVISEDNLQAQENVCLEYVGVSTGIHWVRRCKTSYCHKVLLYLVAHCACLKDSFMSHDRKGLMCMHKSDAFPDEYVA